MSLVINFSINEWTESMLSITSSQKCSLIYLVQKETQCFYLPFWRVKIIDFKNNFISAILPCYKDLDCIVPS